MAESNLHHLTGHDPAFVSGHEVADTAASVAVGAMVLFAIQMFIRRYVSLPVAMGSIALSIVFPPFLAPGFGAIVLLIATCAARAKRLEAEQATVTLEATGGSLVGAEGLEPPTSSL